MQFCENQITEQSEGWGSKKECRNVNTDLCKQAHDIIIPVLACHPCHLQMIVYGARDSPIEDHNCFLMGIRRNNGRVAVGLDIPVSERGLGMNYAIHYLGYRETVFSYMAALVHVACYFCCMVNWSLMMPCSKQWGDM